jgi:hypothetical protein
MYIQYSCTFCFLPSLCPQRKREGPSEAEMLREKTLRTICKPRRTAYWRPWCKVPSNWNDFFFLPPKQKFWENAQDMTRLACRRKQDRGLKKWRICWRDRREKKLISIFECSMGSWTRDMCTRVFWNHWDREVSVTDTSNILTEGMSINEVGRRELSAFFIPNKSSFL